MDWYSIKNDPTNNRGVPDRLFIKHGKCIFVEFKLKNGKLSKVQEAYIKMLDQNIIAPTFVINDFYKFKESLHSIEALFKSFMDKAYEI